MKKLALAGIIVIAAGISIQFVENDDALGFISGILVGIGVGLALYGFGVRRRKPVGN